MTLLKRKAQDDSAGGNGKGGSDDGGVVARLQGLSPSTRALIVVAGATLVLALPFMVGQSWTRLLVVTGFNVMMAIGLNVIVGYTGLLNLGYIAYMGIGAYMWAILASPQWGLHWPFLVVLVLAAVLTAIVGALLAIPALPLRGDYLALVTLGFAEIFRLLAINLRITNYAQGIAAIDHPRILGWTLVHPKDYYYVVLALCLAEVFVIARLERSRIGRAWKAIREDQSAALAMGINASRLKLLASAIGVIPAAVVGVLFAGIQAFVSPDSFKIVESIAILSVVIVGGVGSIPGIILGAALLTIAPEPLRRYTEGYRILIYAGVLILFVLFRPQGIWPTARRGRVRQVAPATQAPGQASDEHST